MGYGKQPCQGRGVLRLSRVVVTENGAIDNAAPGLGPDLAAGRAFSVCNVNAASTLFLQLRRCAKGFSPASPSGLAHEGCVRLSPIADLWTSKFKIGSRIFKISLQQSTYTEDLFWVV